MEKEQIAPCGMNCAICRGYLAFKNDVRSKGYNLSYCTGCRVRNKQCAFIKKRCPQGLLEGKIKYCYECGDFPCVNLQKLDDRYRRDYRMSMIENLKFIKKNGMAKFLKSEEEKWKCPECGETICCHNGICFNCGLDKLQNTEDKYHWQEK